MRTAEEKRVYSKAYYAANKDKCLAYAKGRRERKLEENRAYAKEYNSLHKDERKEYRKKYEDNAEVKAQLRAYNRRYKSENTKEYRLGLILRHKYKMTVEDKQRMWDTQLGLCSVCKEQLPGIFETNCQVDHCHETNKVRALLHGWCNRLVGILEKRTEHCNNAVDYILSHKEVMR